MPRPFLLALALLLPLLSRAGDAPSTSPDPPRTFRRLLIRPGAADAQVQEVLVAGGVTTIIRTPWGLHRRRPASLARTRPAPPFELLVGRGKVVVTPTRALVPGERFALVLRLEDDTVVPLALVGAARAAADGEVRLALDPNDSEELRVQLAAATSRAQGLEAQLRQALQEQDSEDFALAGLLAGGNVHLTALEKVRERQLVADEHARITVASYATASDRHGGRKVALVFTIANRGAAPMQVNIQDVSRRSTLALVPYAARAQPLRVAPGASGLLSVVLDGASPMPDEDPVTLELAIRRGGAQTQLALDVSEGDFASWWLF